MSKLRPSPKNQPKLDNFVNRKRSITEVTTEEPAVKSARTDNMGSNGEHSNNLSADTVSRIVTENNETLKTFLGQMIKSMGDSISDSVNKKIGEVSKRMTALEEAQEHTDGVISSLRKEIEFLKKQIRENNIIIHGIPEQQRESPATLKSAVTQRFTEMGFTDISIEKVSRIGRNVGGKPRLTKVKLLRQSDKDQIIHSRGQHGSTKIHEDLTPEERKVRKVIGDLVGLMRKQGKEAKFRGDHAVVDRRQIKYEEALKIL